MRDPVARSFSQCTRELFFLVQWTTLPAYVTRYDVPKPIFDTKTDYLYLFSIYSVKNDDSKVSILLISSQVGYVLAWLTFPACDVIPAYIVRMNVLQLSHQKGKWRNYLIQTTFVPTLCPNFSLAENSSFRQDVILIFLKSQRMGQAALSYEKNNYLFCHIHKYNKNSTKISYLMFLRRQLTCFKISKMLNHGRVLFTWHSIREVLF